MRPSRLSLVLLVFAAFTVQLSSAQTSVVVRNIAFEEHTLPADVEAQLTAKFTGRTYRPETLGEISERVRDAYQRLGYFKAAVQYPIATVADETPAQKTVDIVIAVQPGAVYRLSTISFKNATAFPVEELRRQVPLGDGDVFDVEQIRKGLSALRSLYASRGYVDFTPVPNTRVDDVDHTVELNFDLDEGPVYRLGSLSINEQDCDPAMRDRLLKAWQPFRGQIYDGGSILDQYMRAANIAFKGKSGDAFEVVPDPKTRLVHVFALERLYPQLTSR